MSSSARESEREKELQLGKTISVQNTKKDDGKANQSFQNAHIDRKKEEYKPVIKGMVSVSAI